MSLLNLDFGLSAEYAPLVNDLMKQATIRIIAHLIGLWAINQLGEAFNIDWLQSLMYVLIGFIVYHLVVNKLLQITYK